MKKTCTGQATISSQYENGLLNSTQNNTWNLQVEQWSPSQVWPLC